MAARILKCGTSRVWLDPARSADIEEAITAADVRKLISDGVIAAKPKKGLSSFRTNKKRLQKKKGRMKGKGSRKGATKTRAPRKKAWMSRIRTIRKLLRELKAAKRIENSTYRDVYVKARSGLFRSRSHVMIYLERNNLVRAESKEEKKK